MNVLFLLLATKPEWYMSIWLPASVLISLVLFWIKISDRMKKKSKEDAERITKIEMNQRAQEDKLEALKKKGERKISEDNDYTKRLITLETNQRGLERRFDKMECTQEEMLKLLHEIKGKIDNK